NECIPYYNGKDLIACICNATYCDDIPNDDQPKLAEHGTFYWYVSNLDGLRMNVSTAKIDEHESHDTSTTLVIDTETRYQRVFGFGAGITDSVGINLKKLSEDTQNQVIRTCYDPKVGSGYNIARIPIAGTDFSKEPYTYDDVDGDTSLEHFALAQADYDYKMPFLKKALAMNPTTKIISAPWSAPGWMKTSGQYEEFGYLKEEYYQIYANYLVKFLEEYQKNGLEMWAMATSNEPTVHLEIHLPNIISMGWTPEGLSKWVANNLGPTMASSKSNNTHILALGDYLTSLPWFVEPMLSNENASKYIVGTSVHWYFENRSHITVLDGLHDEFPDKIILMTEASQIPQFWGTPDALPQYWDLAQDYILSIIEYFNHWASGWMDWNMALNEEGGPDYPGRSLNAAILVNPEKDEFYKTPLFYAIKHFSRFVCRDSIRVSITDTETIKTTAFVTPSKEVVVVLYNNQSTSDSVTLKDPLKGTIQLNLTPRSMNTITYKL
ncbi:Glucosylceramidase, partial [Dufourea novaeangliae]